MDQLSDAHQAGHIAIVPRGASAESSQSGPQSLPPGIDQVPRHGGHRSHVAGDQRAQVRLGASELGVDQTQSIARTLDASEG